MNRRRKAGLGLVALLAFPATVAAAAEPVGAALTFAYTADLLGNVRGGRATGARYLGKLEAGLEGSAGPVTWTLAGHHVAGGRISRDLVGDVQMLSNIEAPSGLRVAEAWIAREFGAGTVTLKAGVIDLNAEFDVQETGGLFLNSSHGVGPDLSQTGRNGPSIFPTTGLGVVGQVRGGGWTLRAGLFDGVPGDPGRPRAFDLRLSRRDGALGIAELELPIAAVTARLGAWGYTDAREAPGPEGPDGAPSRVGDDHGGYLLLAAPLATGLDGWVRAGWAEARIYPIDSYLGGGLVWSDAWLPGDALGVAVAHARFGGPVRRAATDGLPISETALEATYRLPVGEATSLQPNVQFIRRPGSGGNIRDALVVGLRVAIAGRLE